MSPTQLGSQVINKFSTTELVGILKCSSLFDKVLKTTCYDSDLFHKVGRNMHIIQDGLEKNDCESVNMLMKVQWKKSLLNKP
jgi:hypothetical protein